jgi:hypothetical protein
MMYLTVSYHIGLMYVIDFIGYLDIGVLVYPSSPVGNVII